MFPNSCLDLILCWKVFLPMPTLQKHMVLQSVDVVEGYMYFGNSPVIPSSISLPISGLKSQSSRSQQLQVASPAHLAACFCLPPCLAYNLMLKMEVISSSKTSRFLWRTKKTSDTMQMLLFEAIYGVTSCIYVSQQHMGFQSVDVTAWSNICQSQSQSQSHIVTDSQSASQSWCRAPSGAHAQIFITVWQSQSCLCGAPSLTRGQVCLFSEPLSAVINHLSWCKRYLQFYTLYMVINVHTICTGLLSVQAQYSRLCPYF
jgi:hypothetical protein